MAYLPAGNTPLKKTAAKTGFGLQNYSSPVAFGSLGNDLFFNRLLYAAPCQRPLLKNRLRKNDFLN
jgi:hypothetical protein